MGEVRLNPIPILDTEATNSFVSVSKECFSQCGHLCDRIGAMTLDIQVGLEAGDSEEHAIVCPVFNTRFNACDAREVLVSVNGVANSNRFGDELFGMDNPLPSEIAGKATRLFGRFSITEAYKRIPEHPSSSFHVPRPYDRHHYSG